jgi:hypothetical protein
MTSSIEFEKEAAYELLKKLQNPLPHCGYFDNDEKVVKGRWSKYGLTLFVAISLIVFGTSIAYHFLNVCLNYTNPSFLGIAIFYCVIAFMTMALFGVYAKHVRFCTQKQRDNHTLLAIALVSSMASVLNWYDFYSYNLNLFAAGMAFFMTYVVFLLFVAVFLEGHLRSCPDHRTHLRITEGGYEFTFDVFIGLWFVAWITFIIIICFYDADIYTAAGRPSLECVDVNG